MCTLASASGSEVTGGTEKITADTEKITGDTEKITGGTEKITAGEAARITLTTGGLTTNHDALIAS